MKMKEEEEKRENIIQRKMVNRLQIRATSQITKQPLSYCQIHYLYIADVMTEIIFSFFFLLLARPV